MDTRQKRLERKKKHREKVRVEHLEKQRKRLKDQILKDRLDANFTIKHVPDRNDRAGWQRLNSLRNLKDLILKAKELFPEEKVLEEFMYDQIKIGSRDKYKQLCTLLSAAAQSIASEAPYFIPYVSAVPDKEYGFRVSMTSLTLQKVFSAHESAWVTRVPKHLTINGKQYELCFKGHAIERLYDRTNIYGKTPIDRVNHNSLFICVLAGMLPEISEPPDKVALVNSDPSITGLVGIHKPFGYCPIKIEGDKVIAITFLLPGMDGTPERELLGERVEIKDITSIHKLQENMDKNGIDLGLNLFTRDTREEWNKIEKTTK